MAERQPNPAQSAAARKRPGKAAKSGSATPLPADAPGASQPARALPQGDVASRIKELEKERDRLQFELDTARERVTLLERTSREVLERIAGVINSLHSLPKE